MKQTKIASQVSEKDPSSESESDEPQVCKRQKTTENGDFNESMNLKANGLFLKRSENGSFNTMCGS